MDIVKALAQIDKGLNTTDYIKESIRLIVDFFNFPYAGFLSRSSQLPETFGNIPKRQFKSIESVVLRALPKNLMVINDTLPSPWGEIARIGFKSLVIIPVISEGNLAGAFVFPDRKRHDFTDKAAYQLECCGNILSSMLEMYVKRVKKSTTLLAKPQKHSSAAVIITDADGKIIETSGEIRTFFDIDPSTLIGGKISDLKVPSNIKNIINTHSETLKRTNGPVSDLVTIQTEGSPPERFTYTTNKFMVEQTIFHHHKFQPDIGFNGENHREESSQANFAHKILAGIHRITVEPLIFEGIDMVLSDLGNHLKVDRISIVKVNQTQPGAMSELKITRTWVADVDDEMFDYENSVFRLVLSGVKNGTPVCGAFDGISEIDLRSIIVAPLYLKGSFWGFITCEAKKVELNWSLEQVKNLSILGEAIINTIIDHDTIARIENDIENYKLFIRESPTSIVIVSLKTGEIIEISNGFSLLTGLKPEEVIGKNTQDIGLYEDPAVRNDFFERIRKNGRVLGFGVRIVTKNGTKKDILLSGEAIFAQGERLIVSTAQDVTELKNIQHELSKSEELNKAIIKSLPEYIVITNNEDVITDAKNGIPLTLKTESENLVGSKFIDILPNDLSSLFSDATKKLTQTNQTQTFEFESIQQGIKKFFSARIAKTSNKELIHIIQDITSFKTSESLLEGTKNKFQKIFNMSPQAIVIIDREFTKITDCNNQFQTLTGKSANELVNQPYDNNELFANNPQLRELFVKISKNGNHSNVEIALNDSSGEQKNYVISASKAAISEDEEHIIQFTDVSELSQIKRVLSESDDRFRMVVTQSTYPSAIFELETGMLVLFNEDLVSLLGNSFDQKENATVKEIGLFCEECFESFISDLKEYGFIKDKIISCAQKQGVALDLLVSAKTIGFANKNCVFASFQDITPLKLANRAIMESEERYRLLVENSPLGTLFVENNGHVLSTNKAFLTMFGFEESDDLTGINMIENQLFVSSGVSEDIIACIECNETIISERHANINDSDIYIVVYATPFHNENGTVQSIQLIFEDITITKMVEMELKQAINQAQSASSAKSEFLANMSHEIRTPLNALLGFVQLLSGDVKDEKQRQYISAIETAAQALNSMTSSLLDISKIEAGKIVIDYSAQDIAGLIRDSILLTEPRSREHENNIVFNFTNEPSVYMIDPDRFKQVMINLLGNAVKFTKKGVITVTLKILKGEGSHDTITIDVDDTGIGIPTEMRDTVFEPFMQVDSSATRKFEGTGLGLAIVKGLVEKMNGSIRIVEKKTSGSLFRIIIDLERVMSQSIRIAKSKDVVICLKNEEEIELFKSVLSRTNLNLHVTDNIPENLKFIKLLVADLDQYDQSPYKDLLLKTPVLVVGSEIEDQKNHGIKRPVEKNTIISSISKLFPDEPELAFLNLAGKRILIVEDNQLNIVLLKDILSRMGCEVQVSTSGIEAVDMMKKGDLDACLMDVQMPDLSGLDATMQMRYFEETSTRTRLPIIALTAYATKEDRDRCINAGMDDFVAKPFKMSDLLTALSKAIHKSHLDSQKGVIEKLAERLLIDPEKLREFLGNFVQTSIKMLSELEDLINKGEYTNALKLTHTIKGMAYVEDLHKSIVKLEGSLRKQENTASFLDLAQLRNNLEKLASDIEK